MGVAVAGSVCFPEEEEAPGPCALSMSVRVLFPAWGRRALPHWPACGSSPDSPPHWARSSPPTPEGICGGWGALPVGGRRPDGHGGEHGPTRVWVGDGVPAASGRPHPCGWTTLVGAGRTVAG